jgi:signal transduction histidine kinase
MTTKRTLLLAAAALVVVGAKARADDFGSGPEARAMLDRAVAAVKANKSAALTKFIKGEDGFRDRDLYVFCAALNGTVVAHPTRLGENMGDEADKNGKLFGLQMLRTAQEGKIGEIDYMWPRPGIPGPVPKDSYYTKVDGLVCGVGFYKQTSG